MADQNKQAPGTSIVGETDAQGNKIINYDGIFPTLMGKVKMPEFDVVAMSNALIKYSKTDNSPEGWSSFGTQTDMSKVPQMDDLAQALMGAVVSATRELKLNVRPEDAKLMLWASVMKQGGYLPSTAHPGAAFVGVFWLQGGKRSTPLFLMSPLRQLRQQLPRPERMEDTGPFTADQMFIEPDPGQLVFWPSWLEYQSPKHTEKPPRIAVHFAIHFPFVPSTGS